MVKVDIFTSGSHELYALVFLITLVLVCNTYGYQVLDLSFHLWIFQRCISLYIYHVHGCRDANNGKG